MPPGQTADTTAAKSNPAEGAETPEQLLDRTNRALDEIRKAFRHADDNTTSAKAESLLQQFRDAAAKARIGEPIVDIDPNMLKAYDDALMAVRPDVCAGITGDTRLQKIRAGLMDETREYNDFLNSLKRKYANDQHTGPVPKGSEQEAVLLPGMTDGRGVPDYIMPDPADLTMFRYLEERLETRAQTIPYVQNMLAAIADERGLKPFNSDGTVNTDNIKLFFACARSFERTLEQDELSAAKPGLPGAKQQKPTLDEPPRALPTPARPSHGAETMSHVPRK